MGGLRGLPFRVVCAIGLNDGAFPGGGRPPEFDLMALRPRRGDRQRALDERNLFLDLLLAARERFYLSYAGRSLRDNSPRPPSVLVDELLDWLVRACAPDAAAGDALRRRLRVEHPLQPFSRECFLGPPADPRLRSFNDEYCEAQRAALRARPAAGTVPAPRDDEAGEAAGDEGGEAAASWALTFFPAPLAQAAIEQRSVALEGLIRFFANPCRWLLRERLGIALPEGEEQLLDDEPFLPDRPGRQALARRLLPAALAGAGADALLAQARAGIEYPAGMIGEVALAGEVGRLRGFAAALAQDLAAPCPEPLSASLAFDLDGEAWSLAGSIAPVHAGRLVRWRYDETRVTDYLAGWMAHLFACAGHPDGAALETCWHSRDGVFRFAPCRQPGERLETLLRLYRRGLTAPLPFFPRSAWEYVTNGGSMGKARARWTGHRDRSWGEERDPAYRLALRGVGDPLAGEFADLAQAVYQPLLDHLEDPRR
jgi:exodeoxyribonuclease V gamma subunit